MEIRILEAHLVSAQVEAVAGALVSEEAVSVEEEPVADSKHNKRESFSDSPFSIMMEMTYPDIDYSLQEKIHTTFIRDEDIHQDHLSLHDTYL